MTSTGGRPGETLDAASSQGGANREYDRQRLARARPYAGSRPQSVLMRRCQACDSAMRHCLRCAAGALFLSPLLGGIAPRPGSQQPAASARRQRRAGRRPPSGRRPGRARRRRAAAVVADARPVLRLLRRRGNAAGRVLLGGANPKDARLLWTARLGSRDTPCHETSCRSSRGRRRCSTIAQTNELEPHTRCKPSGVTRQFLTPYGVEFVELAELQRIYIFDIGGPHTFRTIYMDGRSHPQNLAPSYYGHSIGWWEGDTLVVDTIGFNEGFWLDRRGLPHTEQAAHVERFTRTDRADDAIRSARSTIRAPTPKPWTGGVQPALGTGTELFEYVCQQANYAHELMVGEAKSVDRTTTIIP